MVFGFDPGASFTGMSVVHKARLLWHKTQTGENALTLIPSIVTIYNIRRAVVEMPRMGVFYGRHLQGNNAIMSMAGQIKLAQNVGENIALTKRIIAKLKECGCAVRECNPKRGSTKWPVEHWKRVFNWDKRHPSSHARDASVLALMNENWIGWKELGA
jgi:hypothetical protein